MPTLKRGDLEKAVRNLGFSRRKARQAVQKTFQLMGKWLAKDRRMPLELGSRESKEVVGNLRSGRSCTRGGQFSSPAIPICFSGAAGKSSGKTARTRRPPELNLLRHGFLKRPPADACRNPMDPPIFVANDAHFRPRAAHPILKRGRQRLRPSPTQRSEVCRPQAYFEENHELIRA